MSAVTDAPHFVLRIDNLSRLQQRHYACPCDEGTVNISYLRALMLEVGTWQHLSWDELDQQVRTRLNAVRIDPESVTPKAYGLLTIQTRDGEDD